jgi:hypothetical protein
MKDDNNKKRAELLNAHIDEMNEPVSLAELKFKIISKEQIDKIQYRYSTMCAEYAACKGIFACYHAAGLDELAESFGTGAAVASESVRAVAEILDVLGVEHIKMF